MFIIVLALIGLKQGETTSAVSWSQLVAAGYVGLHSAWLSYMTVILPVIRIDSSSIAWRWMTVRRFEEVRLCDVAGYRFQDSFDLRLQLRDGGERSIRLNQIAKRDRAILVDRIKEITSDAQ